MGCGASRGTAEGGGVSKGYRLAHQSFLQVETYMWSGRMLDRRSQSTKKSCSKVKKWDCASDIVTISFKSSLRYFFSIFTSGGLLPGAIDNPLDKPSLPPIKAAAVTESYGARRPRTSNPGFR